MARKMLEQGSRDITNTRRVAVVIKQAHLYDSEALTRLRNPKP